MTFELWKKTNKKELEATVEKINPLQVGYDSEETMEPGPPQSFFTDKEGLLLDNIIDTIRVEKKLGPKMRKISETLPKREAWLEKKKQELDDSKYMLKATEESIKDLENTTIEELEKASESLDLGPEFHVTGDLMTRLNLRMAELEREVKARENAVKLFETDLKMFRDQSFQ